MQALKLVHPETAPTALRVEASIRLEGSLLSALFKVSSPYPSFTNPALPLDGPQWGLWDWDVVELFVSCGGQATHLPYYEFQVSPLGQHLELEILEPRKQTNRDFRSGFSHAARRLDEGSWEAELHIPLDRLGWNGDAASIRGNAYAILGPRDARTYWSAFLEPQTKPDFHLPQKFRRLV